MGCHTSIPKKEPYLRSGPGWLAGHTQANLIHPSPSLQAGQSATRCRWAAGLPPVGAEAGELPWTIAQRSASEPRLQRKTFVFGQAV